MIVYINGTQVTNVNSDYNEDIKRTKELDQGKITVIFDNNDEAFDVDSQVLVTIDSTDRYFLLAEDDFDQVSKSPFTYEHKLSLVEVTSYLEGITLPNITFRNKPNGTLGDGITYSVWDQLVRLREIAKLVKTTTTERLWDYSSAIIPHLGMTLQAYTSLIKGKQLTLNQLNAREAHDEIFAQINAEVRMIDFTTVSADFINVKNDEIDTSDLIIYKGRHLINQYADKVDMFIENSISEDNLNKQAIIYPGAEAWASVRGASSFLTSDDFIMEVPEPIQEILKFEIYAEITSTVLGSSFSETIEIDITELLLEKTAFDGLDYVLGTSAGNAYYDTVGRNNSVYYEKGGTRILGFHEKLDKFAGIGGVYFAYRHLLSYAAYKFVGGSPAAPRFDSELDDYENFMFRLTYVSRQNERLRIEKDVPLGNRTLFINQSERIPDIEKLGNKLREDIKNIGNKQLIVGKRVSSYANTIQMGDYIGDYITDFVHNYVDKGEYVSVATLHKGARNISLDVGINTENRDTTIDDKNAVIRHELYDEYIELTNGALSNTSLITSDGIKRYAEMFNTAAIIKESPVELCHFLNDGSAQRKTLACKSVGTANVIKFDFGFDSVNIVGRSSELVDGLWTSKYIDYVGGNIYARVSEIEFNLISGVEARVDTFANHVTIAQALPLHDTIVADVLETYFEFDTAVRLNVLKDGGEILKMTYQMGHYSTNSFVYIGDKMSTNNPLVVKDKETLYLYKSSTPFERDNFIGSYDERLLITNGTPILGEIQLIQTVGTDNIHLAIQDSSEFYWAIGNFEQETYLIMNHILQKIIYINFRNQRSE